VDVEQRRDAVLERLRGTKGSGGLSAELVRQAAAAADVSPRTVYRWLAQGERRPRGHRTAWVLPDRAFELLVTWRDNVAAVHRQLIAEGAGVPDMETLRRAIARELSLAQRDYITDGDDGVRKRAVYLRHEARFRGECYEGDHKQLSIEVLAPRATRAQRPSATLFVDQFSRLIVGWALSLQPTVAEVLAAVRMAVVEDPERPFGGVPARLRWDHGHEFGADAVEQAGGVLGCVSVCCEPYSPWQKGKIERLNRTLEDELLRGLPRWTAGPRDNRGELVGEAPLTLAYFSVLFADYVERYNTRRGHSALGGLTPLQAWQSDSTPLQRISVEQARWMLKARQERVIAKDGIHHRGRIYFAPELSGLGGERVQVAFMPHDLRSIDVYYGDRFVATAIDQADLTDAQKRAALARRQADAKAIEQRTKRARRAARLRVAPITAGGEIDEITPLPPPPAAAAQGLGVLRLLGRADHLNQARDEDAGR
jgi:putative transposase